MIYYNPKRIHRGNVGKLNKIRRELLSNSDIVNSVNIGNYSTMKVKTNKGDKEHENRKFKTSRETFWRAVNLINNKDVKSSSLDVIYSKTMKMKVLNLCSHDTTIPNLRRQNIEVLPTNTQLLLSQLRKCISEHNWSAAARCVYYLLDMNGKLLPLIWKSVVVILLNHPKVSAQNMNDFLQLCLALRTYSEKTQFLLELLLLPGDIRMYSRKIARTGASSDEDIDKELL